MKKTVLVLIIVCLTGALSSGATQARDLRQLVITQTMHQARISVQPDETFTIELEVDGGSGLQWYLDGFDEDSLIYCGQIIQVPVDQDPSFFGGHHAVRYKLRARDKGESQLRFLYYRPWEGPELAEKEFEVTIVVTP